MKSGNVRFSLRLLSSGNEKALHFDGSEFTLGRSSAHADLAAEVDALSRRHLQIKYENNSIWVTDLGSKNGTYLDGRALLPQISERIAIGQKIRLGRESDYLVISRAEVTPDSTSDEDLLEQMLTPSAEDAISESMFVTSQELPTSPDDEAPADLPPPLKIADEVTKSGTKSGTKTSFFTKKAEREKAKEEIASVIQSKSEFVADESKPPSPSKVSGTRPGLPKPPAIPNARASEVTQEAVAKPELAPPRSFDAAIAPAPVGASAPAFTAATVLAPASPPAQVVAPAVALATPVTPAVSSALAQARSEQEIALEREQLKLEARERELSDLKNKQRELEMQLELQRLETSRQEIEQKNLQEAQLATVKAKAAVEETERARREANSFFAEARKAEAQAKETRRQAEAVAEDLLSQSEARLTEAEDKLRKAEEDALYLRELARTKLLEAEIKEGESTRRLKVQQELIESYEGRDIAIKARIDELQGQFEELNIEKVRLEKHLRARLDEIDWETFEQEKFYLARREELDSEIATVEKSRSEKISDLSECERVVKTKQDEIQEVDDRIRVKQALVKTLESKVKASEEEAAVQKSAFEVIGAAVRELQTEKSDLVTSVTRLKLEKSDAFKSIEDLREDLRREKDEFENRSRKLQAELDTKRAELDLHKKKIDNEIEEASGRKQTETRAAGLARVERQEAEKSLAAVREELSSLRAEAAKHDSRTDELRTVVKALESKKHETELRITELKGELDEVAYRKTQYDLRLEETKSQIKVIAEQADAEKADIVAKAKVSADELLRSTRTKAEAELVKAQAESETLVREARQEADRLLSEGRSQFETERNDSLNNFESQLSDKNRLELERFDAFCKENADKQETFLRQLEDERLARARSNEIELADIRLKAVADMDRAKVEWERSRNSRRKSEVIEVTRLVDQLVRSRMGGLVESKGAMNLSDEIRRSVEVALKQEGSQPSDELKSFVPSNPNADLNRKKFWRQFGVKIAMGAAVLMLLIFSPTLVSSFKANVYDKLKKEQNSDQYAKQVQADRDSRVYRPEKKNEYRPTYWENVLYADRYTEMKKDPDMQKKWTLELNRFFIDNLDFNDRVIVDYIAQEKGLLVALEGITPTITIDNLEFGLGRLREAEADSQKTFVDLLKGDENYKKFRAFEERFYLTNMGRLRLPASQSNSK